MDTDGEYIGNPYSNMLELLCIFTCSEPNPQCIFLAFNLSKAQMAAIEYREGRLRASFLIFFLTKGPGRVATSLQLSFLGS